jgi:cytoskeletal protein CcmA (bactofilin family)
MLRNGSPPGTVTDFLSHKTRRANVLSLRNLSVAGFGVPFLEEHSEMSNPYDNAQDKISVLGPTLTFKGELTAKEDLMLKGRVEGSIVHTASLRIGEEGSVKGNISAKHITVEGTVEGDLHATAAVSVKESAHIKGNIYAPTVSLIEGAHFKGSIDMDKGQQAAESPRSRDAGEPDGSRSDRKVAVGGK